MKTGDIYTYYNGKDEKANNKALKGLFTYLMYKGVPIKKGQKYSVNVSFHGIINNLDNKENYLIDFKNIGENIK